MPAKTRVNAESTNGVAARAVKARAHALAGTPDGGISELAVRPAGTSLVGVGSLVGRGRSPVGRGSAADCAAGRAPESACGMDSRSDNAESGARSTAGGRGETHAIV